VVAVVACYGCCCCRCGCGCGDFCCCCCCRYKYRARADQQLFDAKKMLSATNPRHGLNLCLRSPFLSPSSLLRLSILSCLSLILVSSHPPYCRR
jgi:hypothetical protein